MTLVGYFSIASLAPSSLSLVTHMLTCVYPGGRGQGMRSLGNMMKVLMLKKMVAPARMKKAVDIGSPAS